MAEIDPYAVLGVARTAARDEIARAYRALAKRHHPDVGAPISAQMTRINEAWHILSDPSRRARWDRRHPSPVDGAPHWASATATAPAARTYRPPPPPQAPPSRMDSGWAAVAVVIGVVLVVAAVMVGVSLASAPEDPRLRFEDPAIAFLHPPEWTVVAGAPDEPDAHRLVAHLVTYGADPDLLCTSFGEACGLDVSRIPAGEASIIITAFSGGTPPEPDPTARGMVGGRPAAFEAETVDEDTRLLWWQLSPPDFPDRWIEVRAVTRGLSLDQEDVRAEVEQLVESIDLGG